MRLAVLLNRSRSTQALPPIGITTQEGNVQLSFPGNWLENNPLSDSDLQGERQSLAEVGISLSYS